jgi:multidrug efflux pump subunit AcrB
MSCNTRCQQNPDEIVHKEINASVKQIENGLPRESPQPPRIATEPQKAIIRLASKESGQAASPDCTDYSQKNIPKSWAVKPSGFVAG